MRVEGMGDMQDVYEKKFEVTSEWCLAINNIDYVRQSLIPFTAELGMDELIQNLADTTSPLDAERCKHTLDTVIANSIDTVRNKIIELLETVVLKVFIFLVNYIQPNFLMFSSYLKNFYYLN